jgi:predicted nuclease of restriction endonuclease-like (RecB) superfamily
MKQFYETYFAAQIVSPPVTQLQNNENQESAIASSLQTQLTDIRKTILVQIGWTHHLIILARANAPEERAFYIRACILERYSKRELERQISSGLFERTMLGKHWSPK